MCNIVTNNKIFFCNFAGDDSPPLSTGSAGKMAVSGLQLPKSPTSGLDENSTDDLLPNEISAPYEVPQFPIEQIEKKLQIQRQLNVRYVRQIQMLNCT